MDYQIILNLDNKSIFAILENLKDYIPWQFGRLKGMDPDIPKVLLYLLLDNE